MQWWQEWWRGRAGNWVSTRVIKVHVVVHGAVEAVAAVIRSWCSVVASVCSASHDALVSVEMRGRNCHDLAGMYIFFFLSLLSLWYSGLCVPGYVFLCLILVLKVCLRLKRKQKR